MENVDQILNTTNLPDFKLWIRMLAEMGYTSSYKVLNAVDYGVPQSRRRCFMVSMTGGRRFIFPAPCPDGRVLRDVLEDDPDESCYLSEDQIATYERHRIRHEMQGHGLGWKPPTADSIAHTVTTRSQRHDSTWLIECWNLNSPHRIEQTNRVYNSCGACPTICAATRISTGPLLEDARDGRIRIRCLTALECWMLMGFSDEAYMRASEVSPKSALYRQAGNSIAVPCLKAIFKGLYIDKTWIRSPSLEAFA